MIDMTLACASTARLLDGVRDDHLDRRTPCEKLSVRELVAHVGGLGVAFAAAARKDLGELTDTPDEVTICTLTAEALEAEAAEVGLVPIERLYIDATEDHVGSTVVVLGEEE